MNRARNNSGQLLVELLVAIGFGALLITGLLSGLMASRDGKAQEAQRLLATPYLRQLDDAMREVRNKVWTGISTNGTYNPVVSGSDWSLVAGVGTVGGFDQQAVISTVQRNQSLTIVTSGGTNDPATQQIESGVSWLLPVQNGATSTMLLTRYRGNTEVVHTTQAQFNSGTSTQVLTTNTSGGEVQLEGWSAPTTAATVALSKSGLAIVATGTRAYVGTINSATTEFRIYNIVNPAAPVLSGSLEIGFDVNAIALYGNYAFLALNNKNDELEVVDVSNPAAPSQAALLNLAGNNVGAASVAVSPDGTKLYLGKLVDGGGPEFFVIDISTPTAPAVLGSLELTANVNGISIVGNSAYLATSDNVKELNVINISNPAAPSSAGVFSTPGNVDGVSVFATSTTVFLGTLNSASQEFFILNAATPSAITQIGSFEVTRSVFSIYVSSNVAFLGSDAAGKQVQILNLYNYTTPTLFTSINTGQNVLSVFFQGQYLYAADVTDFRTILGNTAADFFSDGTFESPTIDPGASVAYNYLTWSTTTPASTNVRFQVAANTDNKSWNNYVGPDGTSATYYIAPGAIPLSIAGNRYFRWKAYFNTSLSGTTPILQDVTVNYSP